MSGVDLLVILVAVPLIAQFDPTRDNVTRAAAESLGFNVCVAVCIVFRWMQCFLLLAYRCVTFLI